MRGRGEADPGNNSASAQESGRQAQRYPTLQLAHRAREQRTDDHYRATYDLFSVGIARPPKGRTTASLPCGTCSEELTVTVYSLPSLHLLRVRRVALGCAALVLLAAACYGGILLFTWLNGLHTAWSVLLFFLAVLLSFVWLVALIGAVALAVSARSEDGVRVSDASDRHSLRKPGDTETYISYQRGWNEPGF
jgi:hypothetical protein